MRTVPKADEQGSVGAISDVQDGGKKQANIYYCCAATKIEIRLSIENTIRNFLSLGTAASHDQQSSCSEGRTDFSTVSGIRTDSRNKKRRLSRTAYPTNSAGEYVALHLLRPISPARSQQFQQSWFVPHRCIGVRPPLRLRMPRTKH